MRPYSLLKRLFLNKITIPIIITSALIICLKHGVKNTPTSDPTDPEVIQANQIIRDKEFKQRFKAFKSRAKDKPNKEETKEHPKHDGFIVTEDEWFDGKSSVLFSDEKATPMTDLDLTVFLNKEPNTPVYHLGKNQEVRVIDGAIVITNKISRPDKLSPSPSPSVSAIYPSPSPSPSAEIAQPKSEYSLSEIKASPSPKP